MAIDDLANRPHDCDLLLDQNYYREMQMRYDDLVPAGCRLLLGPRYVLMRGEFLEARKTIRARDGQVRSILLSFGASDPTGETVKALQALASSPLRTAAVDVVVGGANPQAGRVAELVAALPRAELHVHVNYFAKLIAAADLGLGAGGATTWERCFLGLPAVTVVTAPNQARTTRDLGELGAIHVLGEADTCGVETYRRVLDDMATRSEYLRALSHACLEIVPNPPASVAAELLAVEQSA
jgi:UDP-2,4-diacetamido-2,4,6-trideoxy-beta-L-altropyranose hydrolase